MRTRFADVAGYLYKIEQIEWICKLAHNVFKDKLKISNFEINIKIIFYRNKDYLKHYKNTFHACNMSIII